LIVVTGHLRVAPEKIEALRPHARKVLESTRREKGCLLYAYGEDVLDPGLMRIVERWEDWDSLAAHGKSAHIATWREALGEISVIERELTAHEAGEERNI
jgi:quinol monooxygenase YgiN